VRDGEQIHLSVLLVNKDPANSYTVSLSYTGFEPSGVPVVWTFADGAQAITSAQQGSAAAQTVPPYSLTALDLTPTGSGSTTTTTGPGSTTTTTLPSSTTTTTRPPTTTAPAAACQVTYEVTNQWQGGFLADVTIRNGGAAAISGWALAWTFPGDQRITNMWNAVPTQTGTAVSAADAGWNTVISAGGTAAFGFQASFSGTNSPPTAFKLNGTTCTMA
jgi:endoglucanase